MIVGYVIYAGKRFDSKLVDLWFPAIKEGDQFIEQGNGLVGKFGFYKRPVVGAVYQVTYVDEQRDRYYAGGENSVKWVGFSSHKDEYSVIDEIARTHAEEMKSGAPNIGNMSLQQVKAMLTRKNRRDRRLILLQMLEYLGVE